MKNFKLLLLSVGFAIPLVAQQNFSLYPMTRIPQSHLINPGVAPDSKWHLGVPALNSNYLQYSNGGFNFNKIFSITEPANGDSSVINLNRLVDLLAKKNFISVKTEIGLLSGGFKLDKHYFHISVTEKVAARVSLPRDLFRFIIDGNGGANLGETFEFRFKLDAIHYREFGVGYTYKLDDALSFGGRLKVLKGFNILNTKDLNLNFTTDNENFTYTLQPQVEINIASTLGNPIFPDTSDQSTIVANQFLKSNNTGLGLDLGAQFKFGENITFNASVLDLGFIRWNTNAVSLKSHDPNAEFQFDGIHINGKDTNTDFEQYAKDLADTMLSLFKLDTLEQSFTTSLSTEFFIGASYEFNKKLNAGVLFYGDFYNRRFYPGLTFNLLWKPLKSLHLNFTNTFYNRGFINPGLAASFNLGAFQVYGVMDNFLFPFAFASMKSFSIRGGINLTFGREGIEKRVKKKHGDDEAIPETTPESI